MHMRTKDVGVASKGSLLKKAGGGVQGGGRVADIALMALVWLWWRAWVPVDAVDAAAFGVAGVALMALGWLWWHAWVPVDAGDAAAVCVAGMVLGDMDLHFAWQAWRLVTWIVTLRGRCGTFGTGLALVALLGPS